MGNKKIIVIVHKRIFTFFRVDKRNCTLCLRLVYKFIIYYSFSILNSQFSTGGLKISVTWIFMEYPQIFLQPDLTAFPLGKLKFI